MKIVAAPDKFRASLSAAEAARWIALGAHRVAPSGEVIEVPMADGGEGTVEALVAATGGTLHRATVVGPIGDPVEAVFGMLGDGETAALEMASASGLALIPASARDPLRTTTYGTGQLLLRAIEAGARRIILGIGGSATNDGGAGFAQAIGFRLLDDGGRQIERGGGSLGQLARIDGSGVDPRLAAVAISAACDVDNPLCGPGGASAVFGPQKGADPETVARLDTCLALYASIVRRDLGRDVAEVPGAGAAGGLGAGLLAFAGAALEPGVDLVARAVRLEDHLAGADLVLTGEGAIDASSAGGKTAVGVARIARSRGVPAVVLAGSVGTGARATLDLGVSAFASLCNRPMTLEEAIRDAGPLLADASEMVVRIYSLGREA